MQQVHLRINDAATGQPTPVRLRITDADGTYYAPFGRLTEFATGVNQDVGGNVLIGNKKWCYIDGACEILLPPGQLHIEITKGPEYTPIDETITLLAGKMSLRFTIERWCDMRKGGWYSGDTRVHFLSPDAALLEGQAEDVAVVNLLAREAAVQDQFGNVQRAIPNILSFSGQTFAREAEICGVAVNTQNTHAVLGSLGLLHCHRVVYPLTFDSQEWTLDDWCGQCHRKKGFVVWTDPLHETGEFRYGEPLANLILGNVDAFELTFFEDSPFDALADYYKLLNAGLMVPVIGASGKNSNGIVLGSMRTYAFVPPDQEMAYGAWIEAVRSGQNYISNGPLMTYSISVKDALQVRADAKSLAAFEHLELLWNGEVIANVTPAVGSPCQAMLQHEFTPQQSGWLALRCRGDQLLPSRPAPQRVFAHTSPIAIRKNNQPASVNASAVKSLLRELESMREWAETTKFERLLHVLDEARTALTKKLS